MFERRFHLRVGPDVFLPVQLCIGCTAESEDAGWFGEFQLHAVLALLQEQLPRRLPPILQGARGAALPPPESVRSQGIVARFIWAVPTSRYALLEVHGEGACGAKGDQKEQDETKQIPRADERRNGADKAGRMIAGAAVWTERWDTDITSSRHFNPVGLTLLLQVEQCEADGEGSGAVECRKGKTGNFRPMQSFFSHAADGHDADARAK